MKVVESYHPFRDPHLLMVLGIIPVDSAGRVGNVWEAAHNLTISAANYCSEHRIHPAMVCAGSALVNHPTITRKKNAERDGADRNHKTGGGSSMMLKGHCRSALRDAGFCSSGHQLTAVALIRGDGREPYVTPVKIPGRSVEDIEG